MSLKIDTLALHAGARSFEGSVATPVFHSSSYAMEEGVAYKDIRYARLSNSPNHNVLHDRLARIMDAESALSCASGMAAIATTLDEIVPTGGSLMVASTLYGGTAGLLHKLVNEERLAVETFDASASSIGEPDGEVEAIYVETIANPTMEPANLPAIAGLASRLNVPLIVDNTFASPVCARPLQLGAHLVVHSATKYINGHSDVTAGVIAGDESLVGRIRTRLAYNGAMLDPGAAYLLERGLKTLGVRVRRQVETAGRLVAAVRETMPETALFYPSLTEAPWLDSSGAMFAFELPEENSPTAFINALKYFTYAPSLGGVESLIIRPAFGSHAGLSAEEREAMGISDRLIRVSVGLEDPEDLKSDLFDALSISRRAQ